MTFRLDDLWREWRQEAFCQTRNAEKYFTPRFAEYDLPPETVTRLIELIVGAYGPGCVTHFGIGKGYHDCVRFLLTQEKDLLSSKDRRLYRPIERAAMYPDSSMLEIFVDMFGNEVLRDTGALHVAARRRIRGNVEFIMRRCPDLLYYEKPLGCYPFQCTGDLEIVEYLLGFHRDGIRALLEKRNFPLIPRTTIYCLIHTYLQRENGNMCEIPENVERLCAWIEQEPELFEEDFLTQPLLMDCLRK